MGVAKQRKSLWKLRAEPSRRFVGAGATFFFHVASGSSWRMRDENAMVTAAFIRILRKPSHLIRVLSGRRPVSEGEGGTKSPAYRYETSDHGTRISDVGGVGVAWKMAYGQVVFD